MSGLNTNKLLVEKLFSRNTEVILQTLHSIRVQGSSEIVPHLIELLNHAQSREIDLAIIGLLNDLKQKSVRIEIIRALKNQKYEKIHQVLLASCWQSGLDYSEYLDFFVDIFISGSFEIAFEAYTVIESMEAELDQNIRLVAVEKLNAHKVTIGNDKSGLLEDIL
jgi:hypothetical protein